MDRRMEQFVLDLMNSHNIMTIATVRADGWPQATTVAYANDGLTIYFSADKGSQKLRNIASCSKVSLTIDRDSDGCRPDHAQDHFGSELRGRIRTCGPGGGLTVCDP